MSWAHEVSLACRFTMAEVFAVSFVTKVHSRAAWLGFRGWLTQMPLPLADRAAVAAALVAAEGLVAVLVLIPVTAAAGLAASAALSMLLITGLVLALRRGFRAPCHCFGASSDPLSWQHVARNTVLLAVALAGSAGALAGGAAPAPPPTAVAASAGLAVGLLIVFFTDVAALLRPEPASAAPHAHPGAIR